jgi:hypothetical protein
VGELQLIRSKRRIVLNKYFISFFLIGYNV